MDHKENKFDRVASPGGALWSKTLSPRLAALLRESWWLAFGVLTVYVVMILGSYRATDPGWSYRPSVEGQGGSAPVLNLGGELGAWLSDLLFYLFGFSAWWYVVLLLLVVRWGFQRFARWNESESATHHGLSWIFFGSVLLLIGSCGLESLRLYKLSVVLPNGPGGMLGSEIAHLSAKILGFNGGTLLLLLFMAVGWSLATGISWLSFAENLGKGLELFYVRSMLLFEKLVERREDQKVAQVAVEERESFVVEAKKRIEEAPPIKIESPVLEIPPAERVIQETIKAKQASLFEDLPDSAKPSLSLLDPPPESVEVIAPDSLEYTSRLIERKLLDFGVEVHVVAVNPGPVIARYEIELAVGVKGSQILNLGKDLARALSVTSIRIVETIPGKTTMGLELPHPKRQMIRLREILSSAVYQDAHSKLTMALGKDITGNPVVADLAKMPHLLVAGTTGSGKSVGINAMILSLLYKAEPSEVRLIMIDPKMLELSIYEGIPHLLAPVVTDMKLAANALNWCVGEMDRRYRLMSALGVRNIAGYNSKIAEAKKAGNALTNPFSLTPENPEPLDHLPLIVVVIDELADLMMVAGKKIEELIARLAQKARASGIHLILATQRPSVDVITGLIKANVPTRIAFQVSSKIDSRTILDQMGAEALLGQGDMLFLPPGTGFTQRVHGAFVADHEVHHVVEFLKKLSAPQYIEGILDGPASAGEESADGEEGQSAETDPLYDQAVEVVLKTKRPSISLVQRHLRIGYNRAARLIEGMEQAGLITPMGANGNRDVIAPRSNE